MPMTFWEDAFITSAYLINRLPLSPLNGKMPLELMFDIVPDYKALKSLDVCVTLIFEHITPTS